MKIAIKLFNYINYEYNLLTNSEYLIKKHFNFENSRQELPF